MKCNFLCDSLYCAIMTINCLLMALKSLPRLPKFLMIHLIFVVNQVTKQKGKISNYKTSKFTM
jgi:hypothetical protein